mmetsp:Transcript_14169/g.35588  ORF Transcript_14169/g.35588 Transcript_14169/m.35588 type:complete len:210 (-) Transcript_14169:1477-2106(-)
MLIQSGFRAGIDPPHFHCGFFLWLFGNVQIWVLDHWSKHIADRTVEDNRGQFQNKICYPGVFVVERGGKQVHHNSSHVDVSNDNHIKGSEHLQFGSHSRVGDRSNAFTVVVTRRYVFELVLGNVVVFVVKLIIDERLSFLVFVALVFVVFHVLFELIDLPDDRHQNSATTDDIHQMQYSRPVIESNFAFCFLCENNNGNIVNHLQDQNR